MKIAIYYFSATGNSLALSRELKAQLTETVDLIPIVKLLNQQAPLVDSEVVGIIYPAWLHHIPPIVEEFIKAATFKSNYIFAICSYSTSPYNSIFNLNELLAQKGLNLAAGFAIAMGGKYVLLKDLVFAEQHNEQLYTKSKLAIKTIAQTISSRRHVGIEGSYEADDREYSKQLIDIHKNVYKVTEKFWITNDCNACGLCLNICPRSNIKLINNKISWENNCDYCLACLHWCPTAAIQNGELTQSALRHQHPDVTAADIIQQKIKG